MNFGTRNFDRKIVVTMTKFSAPKGVTSCSSSNLVNPDSDKLALFPQRHHEIVGTMTNVSVPKNDNGYNLSSA